MARTEAFPPRVQALRPKHRVNPMLEAEELPARITYIDDGINNVSIGCNSATLQIGINNMSSPKPEHTPGGSGRHGAGQTARRGDAW